ncbi:uncharacterized protein C8R40DRAFT_1235732 [Lentinula edodes]|uniref:uncharacterized protein n=1 Tax=Lentinula edodes TaxID=5353 RepID=UPI001E8CBDF9|nr:uncharacterized protein C8R40DRAFT_1235732 [Lentinula edodes]KAH7877546.1 hypothetical protein C8R40DRAFT_1235732 [Lentinula edodes]
MSSPPDPLENANRPVDDDDELDDPQEGEHDDGRSLTLFAVYINYLQEIMLLEGARRRPRRGVEEGQRAVRTRKVLRQALLRARLLQMLPRRREVGRQSLRTLTSRRVSVRRSGSEEGPQSPNLNPQRAQRAQRTSLLRKENGGDLLKNLPHSLALGVRPFVFLTWIWYRLDNFSLAIIFLLCKFHDPVVYHSL